MVSSLPSYAYHAICSPSGIVPIIAASCQGPCITRLIHAQVDYLSAATDPHMDSPLIL